MNCCARRLSLLWPKPPAPGGHTGFSGTPRWRHARGWFCTSMLYNVRLSAVVNFLFSEIDRMFPCSVVSAAPRLSDVAVPALPENPVNDFLFTLGVFGHVIGGANCYSVDLCRINFTAHRIGFIRHRAHHLYFLSARNRF